MPASLVCEPGNDHRLNGGLRLSSGQHPTSGLRLSSGLRLAGRRAGVAFPVFDGLRGAGRYIARRRYIAGRRPERFARGTARCAFTLMEMVAVMTLSMILAGIAVGSLRGAGEWRSAAAVRRVRSDVLYARHLAVLSGRRTLCTFDAAKNTYELQQETTPSSGPIDASTLNHPLTNEPWLIDAQALAPGLGISKVPSAKGGAVGFSAAGMPIDLGGDVLGADQTVTFSSGAILTISAGSGICEVSWP